MSLSVNQSSLHDFRHGPFCLFRDATDRHVAIPTRKDLEGYLVQNIENKSQQQIRFIRNAEPATSDRLEARWREFVRRQDSDIFPSVLASGRYDGVPFCVTELPIGEPINNFIERNGSVPTEVAARLVLDFVDSLLKHGEELYRNFPISAQSLWISRTAAQPKIVVGEITDTVHSQPESHNAKLTIDLLKFLTKDSENDVALAELIHLLSQCDSLVEIQNLFEHFTKKFPAANYWMGYNEPESLLEKVTFPVQINYDDTRSAQIVQNAKKSLWPVLIAISLTVLAVLSYCFITLHGDPDLVKAKEPKPAPLPLPIVNEPAPAPVRVARVQQAPSPRSVATTTQPVTVPNAPARPQINTYPAKPSRVSNPVHQVTASSIAKPQQEPVINAKPTNQLKSLLSNTGDLFNDILTKPTSEWLIHGDDQKKPSRRTKNESFTAEDAKALEALNFKKASSAAKANNQTLVAIKQEVELLKLVPDSVDARIRLHDYLSLLERKTEIKLTENEVEILVEASAENSKAKDILKLHFSQENFLN